MSDDMQRELSAGIPGGGRRDCEDTLKREGTKGCTHGQSRPPRRLRRLARPEYSASRIGSLSRSGYGEKAGKDLPWLA